jgi:hypothetical protein
MADHKTTEEKKEIDEQIAIAYNQGRFVIEQPGAFWASQKGVIMKNDHPNGCYSPKGCQGVDKRNSLVQNLLFYKCSKKKRKRRDARN